jgi:hypothetical protein
LRFEFNANPNNYRSISYAVLLMAAEALIEVELTTNKARLYLNAVRQRAFGDNNHNITASELH